MEYANGVSGELISRSRRPGISVGECDSEGVGRRLPAHGPSCLADPGRVRESGDQVAGIPGQQQRGHRCSCGIVTVPHARHGCILTRRISLSLVRLTCSPRP